MVQEGMKETVQVLGEVWKKSGGVWWGRGDSSSSNNEYPSYVRVFSLMVLCERLRNIDKNQLVGACF